MIKAILFDIDNTLLDFDASVRQCLRKGLPNYREEYFEVFLQVNREMWQQIEEGSLTYEGLLRDRFDRIFARIGMELDGPAFEDYFRKELFSGAIPVDGAMELLESLSGRYVLCAASNGPYEQQLNRLRVAGMLPYFTHLFISERVGYSKPAEAFFAHCLSTLELTPAEVLMVGDSYGSDIVGAKACGIKTCYFGVGAEADHTVDSLLRIGDIL